MRSFPTTAIVLALLSACKAPGPGQEPPELVQAVPQEPPKIVAKIEPRSLPTIPQQARRIADVSDDAAPAEGLPAIVAARDDALTASAEDGFVNAIQYFPYTEGALYELYAGVGFISTIQLQPGEQLVNYAAGDTSRWIIDHVERGDQSLLLVKPTRPKLRTNLIISTNKRIYLIEAQSHKGDAYNAAIGWTYPYEEVAQQVAVVEAENERREQTVIAGVPLDQLDFGFSIDGDTPRWRPIRAFSDGAKTYIEFPDSLSTSEAPPLFLNESGDGGQLVNYRVKQNYYIVDRLFDQAELRLDEQVVTVSRDGGSGWRRIFAGSTDTTPCKRCDGADKNDYDKGDW